jgi:hypothetical protein
MTTMASPDIPTMMPMSCRRDGRSRSTMTETMTVSTTCDWCSSDARPGGIPSARAM